MNIFLVLAVIIIVIYSCVSWLLPTVLSWLFKRKFHMDLKIGRIAVPKLILKDVELSREGYIININEVAFKSSFFNSDINKLVSVIITDMQISNNVEKPRSVVVDTILKPLLSKQNSTSSKNECDDEIAHLTASIDEGFRKLAEKKPVDFRGVKLPPSLITFAQFMGLHIYNASITIYHGTAGTPWCLIISASEVHADGAAGGPTRALAFCTNLVNARVKIALRDSQHVLCEASCGLTVEGAVKADGPLNVEKIHIAIGLPRMVIEDELYSFMDKQKRYKHPVVNKRNEVDPPMNTIIPRFSPVIPKIFSLKVDETTAVFMDNTTRTSFKFTLQSLVVNSRFSASSMLSEDVNQQSTLPQVYVAFQIDQLNLLADTRQVIALNKLKLDAKLEKGVLNLYLILSVMNVVYNHKDVFTWCSNTLQAVRRSRPMEVKDPSNTRPSWLTRSVSECTVQGCAELRTVRVQAHLNDNTFLCGCAGLKLKLDQLTDSDDTHWHGQAMSDRQWSTELLVDGGWTAAAGAAPPGRRMHAWHSALLAVALLKCAELPDQQKKIEAMMDCLRLEWSAETARTIIDLIDCINSYKSLKSQEKTPLPTPKTTDQPADISINVALSHINLFLIVGEGMCLMTRIDAVSIEKGYNKFGAVISGLKVVDMVPYQAPVPCLRTEDIPVTFFHIKLARLDHNYIEEKRTNSLEIQFLELIEAEWCPNLHLKVLTFVRNLVKFKEEIYLKRLSNGSEKARTPLDWRLSFKNETNLVLILSNDNHMLFTTDDTTISLDHELGLSIIWGQVRMILNGDEIISVEGFSMERLVDDQDIRVERKANDGFQLPWNKVWDINIDCIRVIFPYKHRFADAVQEDFVSLFKWLKLVHNVKKKPFTIDSPLPSDLYIKIEELLIEMSDDPFEVKLRDNYELLEDEMKESQKRRTMLDAKVQELCKPHLFLPAGKVEQLYAALRQKDVQIYVQRCRAAPPPRSRLIACCLNRLRLIALADPSIHGTQNVVARLREIDYDSPWPEEGVEFTTLWCRAINVQCLQWQLLLRDFPQPLLSMSEMRMWGTWLGAEDHPPPRAVRTVTIDQGAPWGECVVERSMMPLKSYYDLCCDMSEMSYAFGPCWEPVIAQCNLAFDQVSRPSLDPSVPLPFWDKIRLLMHGRLTANFRKCTCLLHVSLDPYNTTEEMEVTWNDLVLDWTNGRLGFLGCVEIFARTASKYDDCRVARIPSLKVSVKMGWVCNGEPRDHRAATVCAPTRTPEYSSNQEHDSYRAFRSQGLDLHISMDTKPIENDGPVILLYGSTLRWFESLKIILSGVTRPTRRGHVFNNVRPRKPQLSRHYRSVSVSLTLHNLQVFYWSSSSMQRGVEMLGVRVTCASKHNLTLVPSNDGLIRRPRANWTTVYLNCDLNDAEIWLKSALSDEKDCDKDKDNDSVWSGCVVTGMEKCFCVSVRRVSYGREASGGGGGGGHRLAVHDLRGAWTKQNRDLAFALFDTYVKTQQLKKNLSTKALKDEDDSSATKYQREAEVVSPLPSAGSQSGGVGGLGLGMGTGLGMGMGVGVGVGGSGGASMLAALVLEAGEAGGDAPVVLSEELGGGDAAGGSSAAHPPRPPPTQDHHASDTLIELVNSQVALRGGSGRAGYVLVCAARAEVRSRARGCAAEWAGALASMQYYATPHAPRHTENIQWVSVEEIEERWGEAPINTLPDVPRLVGSGHSAGGVVGQTVGPSDDAASTQLQRIVSRCACEFYYRSGGAAGGGGGGRGGGAGGGGAGGWGGSPPPPYDTFTLVHHDLDVCTNSLQYAMLLDVVNSVVLEREAGRRRTLELRARTRFQLQLQRDPRLRDQLHLLQTQVRESLAKLRRLEKEYYLKNRSLNRNDPVAIEELKSLDKQVQECKEQVWSQGDELDAMVMAWRERQRPPPPAPSSPHAPPHRHSEICFKSARWRLTDADGQLGIADLLLTNFLYTKTSRADDSVEHLLELGYVRVTNLLPNEPFPEVLVPQEPRGRAPLARRAALRVFCRDRPPVGGISVKEHFEVNIVPIKIGLTKKFFKTMLNFCFPNRDPDTIEEGDDDDSSMKPGSSTSSLVSTGSKKIKKKGKDSNSNFYVKRDKTDKDDVEKMKERAEKNKLFIYIKIPEVPIKVSYKGSKEKNLEDVRDLQLLLPTLEYHNVTWTWLDLLLATKSDTRRVMLSQAIRQKLQLHRRAAAPPEPHEEDKARLLLGERTAPDNKPQKKLLPSTVFKFTK